MAVVPQDLLDRINALEREVRELRGRANIRPALNEILNGDVVIGEGGRLFVRAPGGPAVFETGQSPTAHDYFTTLRRDTGALAFTIGANSYEDDDAPSQMVRMWDRNGNVIVMDDYYSPEFLGRPWMPVQLHPTPRQAYTGTSYDSAYVGTGPAHNPVLFLSMTTYAGTGGGQVRVTLTSGSTTTTLDEWDVPANVWTGHSVTRPLHGVRFLDAITLRIEQRAKNANQAVETRLYSAYTRNTRTAAEAPNLPFGLAASPRGIAAGETP
ncbi:hypothetical protein [Streptomyces sp. NPDC056188]|uniref:hypothetical protein n=1 Tax=Streptomyces sp. NPDC056188 TaxID=3345740 RepID=UPI0035DB509B